MQLKASVEIDRPVDEVFNFYADHHVENHPRWDEDVKLTKATSGPLGVGSVIKRHVTRLGRDTHGEMTIVEFERDRAFAVEIHDGPATMVGRATFLPLESGGTRIDVDTDAPTIDDPAVGKAIEGLMARSVANIKRLIEES